ncbi:CTP synthetase [Chlamydia pneumoniae TW-183]|uniref:CTP synthase n=1 Tax=Chlamydia pneumoniae TaxID=83558 RepID=A0A0F7XNT9_CHLPN|nr:CTP synthase [Chlamydia pneumoniae]AAD18389.1 CTP Synthetase [Chlamydia pneumoniae CWL029]AAP98175.1 CTP synthetase [Chlamydia pneumoniae TW-183]ACZ33212.1 CTP synthase [Chlamydia pneumoniae LPCoLN]ETR80104.1 CTP synthase [Chlamydia pneumoniae B21]CRI32735.1 CTP synthase [Chlamydia pneumoniae]
MPFKCIFLTGGVVSSLGKGLTAASLALILERQRLNVAMLKLDPYLNVDPGTMNPFEHGEIYVTDDGVETDLDLGHYHRFSSAALSRHSSATSGQIYARVIKREREGDYLGSTVQVIPHITNEIIQVILDAAKEHSPDVLIVEIGGTIGDIESLPFLEAIRQFRYDHSEDCLNIHMTYVPYLQAADEVKSKPTQHSVQTLRGIGIIPDAILCRSEKPLTQEVKSKISLFCNVPNRAVFNVIDVKHTIYEMPLMLAQEKIANFIGEKLKLATVPENLDDWKVLVNQLSQDLPKVKIGVVGKYVQHRDAYKSIFEALTHAALRLGHAAEIIPIDAEDENLTMELSQCDACLVPGGFGVRGWEGKIAAAKFCREQGIPYFGICLGMQVLVVEYARNVLNLDQANSLEMDPNTPHPIVYVMEGQDPLVATGGTMRLGAYPCLLKPGSKAHKAYNESSLIQERHRHRYEVNPDYIQSLEDHGLRIVGTCPPQGLCEIIEVSDHPWMIGVQFHPEFVSKLISPHPLFIAFIEAALVYSKDASHV